MGKEREKKLRPHWNCHLSTSQINGYTIISSAGIKGRERAMGTRFHWTVSLLISNMCRIHNGSEHIAEEVNTQSRAEWRTRKII